MPVISKTVMITVVFLITIVSIKITYHDYRDYPDQHESHGDRDDHDQNDHHDDHDDQNERGANCGMPDTPATKLDETVQFPAILCTRHHSYNIFIHISINVLKKIP